MREIPTRDFKSNRNRIFNRKTQNSLKNDAQAIEKEIRNSKTQQNDIKLQNRTRNPNARFDKQSE